MIGRDPDPLFPPEPAPERHELVMLAPVGPAGGPTYGYRGARIECRPGGHVCSLFMDGHPFDGISFGVAGTIAPLVDGWLDHGRLPPPYRNAAR